MSDHKGHKFKEIELNGGFCDCGDPSFWDQNHFCELHGGPAYIPTGSVAAKPEPKKNLCQQQIKVGDEAYVCKTCQQSEKSCVCKDCFLKANHTGHEFEIKTTVVGCCDCGDEKGWKNFCEVHGGPKKEPKKSCGKGIKKGDVAYKCKTCAVKGNACLCKDCFENSNH